MRTIARLTLFSTWILLGLLCYRAGAVPAPPEPPRAPIDPSGVWEGYCGDELKYTVTIIAVNGERYGWLTQWCDGDGAVWYAGVIYRDAKDPTKCLEIYDLATTALGPWTLAEREDGRLDSYPQNGKPGNWVLKRAKVDASITR